MVQPFTLQFLTEKGPLCIPSTEKMILLLQNLCEHWLKRFYIAGNFFTTARALIGYLEVTWHLTMKLFPNKISERTRLQNLWRQRVTVHSYARMLLSCCYSEVKWISSFKIASCIRNCLKNVCRGGEGFWAVNVLSGSLFRSPWAGAWNAHT